MAPSAATGATGLERLLLIFLMKTWQITESNEQHLLQRRSIQRSIGQNFTKLRKKPQEHSEPPQKTVPPPETSTSSTNNQTTQRTQISPNESRVSSRNFTSPNKNPNERWKTRNHRTNLKRTANNGCTSTQPRRKLQNLQELTLWMGTGFTRPHGGRLMILPVDQDVGACLVKLGSTCAPLQPPSSAKIHLKNLQKNRAAPLRPIALQRPSQ